MNREDVCKVRSFCWPNSRETVAEIDILMERYVTVYLADLVVE